MSRARCEDTGAALAVGPDGMYLSLRSVDGDWQRPLPWSVPTSEDPLFELQRAGRLETLAVILDALVLEARLMVAPPPLEEPPRPEAPPALASSSPLPAAAPRGSTWSVLAAVQLAHLGQEALAPAFELGATYGSAWLTARLLVPHEELLLARPLTVGRLGMGGAWAPELLSLGGVEVGPRVGLALDVVQVRRSEVPGATARRYVDVTFTGGAVARYGVADGWRVGAMLEATWAPWARRVGIPGVGSRRMQVFSQDIGFFVEAAIRRPDR